MNKMQTLVEYIEPDLNLTEDEEYVKIMSIIINTKKKYFPLILFANHIFANYPLAEISTFPVSFPHTRKHSPDYLALRFINIGNDTSKLVKVIYASLVLYQAAGIRHKCLTLEDYIFEFASRLLDYHPNENEIIEAMREYGDIYFKLPKLPSIKIFNLLLKVFSLHIKNTYFAKVWKFLFGVRTSISLIALACSSYMDYELVYNNFIKHVTDFKLDRIDDQDLYCGFGFQTIKKEYIYYKHKIAHDMRNERIQTYSTNWTCPNTKLIKIRSEMLVKHFDSTNITFSVYDYIWKFSNRGDTLKFADYEEVAFPRERIEKLSEFCTEDKFIYELSNFEEKRKRLLKKRKLE